jgi:acetolactate synthase-1/3 small subunit
MKKPLTTNGRCIFAIYATDKKGLLGQILVYFNRKNYEVDSLNVSRTDISDLVLITLEGYVPEADLLPFTERLKKIIEVFAVITYSADDGLKKVGFYRMAAEALNPAIWSLIGKYGAHLSSIGEKTFVLSKTGSDKDLHELYSKLEGPYLLGFCKSGLIVEESLVPFEAL